MGTGPLRGCRVVRTRRATLARAPSFRVLSKRVTAMVAVSRSSRLRAQRHLPPAPLGVGALAARGSGCGSGSGWAGSIELAWPMTYCTSRVRTIARNVFAIHPSSTHHPLSAVTRPTTSASRAAAAREFQKRRLCSLPGERRAAQKSAAHDEKAQTLEESG